jgi:hypothetical protein
MAVYIFESDAFDKICQVEGPDYARNQESFGNCGFAAFKEQWEASCQRNPRIREYGWDVQMSLDDGSRVIYGWHGWNRYVVYYSGEIAFLGGFSDDESIEEAKRAGFRII